MLCRLYIGDLQGEWHGDRKDESLVSLSAYNVVFYFPEKKNARAEAKKMKLK